MTKHVHVLNTHGLGDVVMSLPMLREIDLDGYRISMTVKSKIEAQLVDELFKPNTAPIDFLFFQQYKKQGATGLLKFALQLFKLKADLIFPAIGVSKPHYNLLAFFSRVRYRVGHGGRFSFLNHFNWQKTPNKHKVELNCDIYRECQLVFGKKSKKISNDPQFPAFAPNKEVLTQLKEKFPILANENLIGLAPGCGEVEKHKRWPIEKFAELATNLLTKSYAVVVIGGPGEEALGSAIASKVGTNANFADLTGQLSVPQTIQLVGQLNKIVVNCNGLSHIASAVNIDIVGIYGPTDPYYTGPFSKKLQVVSNNLECAPCYKRGYISGCGLPVCITGIAVSSVDSEI